MAMADANFALRQAGLGDRVSVTDTLMLVDAQGQPVGQWEPPEHGQP
jgi:hypothetical protein